MPQILKNNVSGVLGVTLSASGTSMTLLDASSFPTPTGGDFYLLTLIGLNTNGQESSWEVVRVTAKASNALTIVRAQEGTVAAVWPAATTVQMRMTADSVMTKTEAEAAFAGKEPSIAAGTTAQYWRGDKTWRDIFTDVRATTLTGLSTATNAVVAATDTVLGALGKLQKQVSDNLTTLTSHTGSTSNPHSVTKAQVGLGSVDNTSDANKPVSAAALTALNGKVATDDARLTDAREWTATEVSQVEAEAGSATTARKWTALRVRQAVAAWWTGIVGAVVEQSDVGTAPNEIPLNQYLGTLAYQEHNAVTLLGGTVNPTNARVDKTLTLSADCEVYQNTSGSFGWRDNIATFIIRGAGVGDPSFGALFGGLEGYLFSATTLNRVFCDFHIDHDIARGTLIYPHVHWMPTTADTGVVRWGIEYSVAKGHQQGVPSTFPATATVYINQTIVGASQWEHHVAEVALADAIPSTNIEPDSVIKMRVFRDAANAADTYPGTVHAWQADLHYQCGRLSTLNKAPNFYA